MIAVADPAEEWDLSAFYYGGKGGRGPARAEIEKTYATKTPNFRCAVYEDFRVMLEKEKAIDAVLIATPDHLHAYVSILAMKAGKHVYCEKPLTHNVWEARQVARVAAETGVATQMGNQGRSSEGHRQTAEWIWDGAIGAVREVHAWSRSPASFGDDLAARRAAVGNARRCRAASNWDLWLGPREPRPYHPAYAPVHLARLLGLRRRRAARHGASTTSTRRSTRSSSTRRRRSRPPAYGDVDEELCSRGLLRHLALRRDRRSADR